MKSESAMIIKTLEKSLPAIQHAGFLDGGFESQQLNCRVVTTK
jgi:hypothetical protein